MEDKDLNDLNDIVLMLSTLHMVIFNAPINV